MDLPSALLAILGALGVGTIVGSFITARSQATNESWTNLRWAVDKTVSTNPAEARLAFNHIDDMLTDGKLTKAQKRIARTAVRDYLRRTS